MPPSFCSLSSPLRNRLYPILGIALAALVWGGAATAQTFPLTLELQTGQVDEFGVVHVEADADGALVFDVEMDSERMGEDASMRRLFFNLLPTTSGLWVEPLDEGTTDRIVVRPANRTLARSGARMDWRVDFFRSMGAMRRGRGPVEEEPFHRVRFRIFADAPLMVDDLLPVSLTRDGTPIQMVVDMKRARTPEGDRVRWVVGSYEPPSEPPSEPPILR